MMPLAFTDDGLLPAGDVDMTFVVCGPGKHRSPQWDMSWRTYLIDNLEILVQQLWHVGIDDIFIDGSFAEDKDHPNDIDGYFVVDLQRFATGVLTRELNLLDPHKIWTWSPASRRPHRAYLKKQLLMWHQYRVELYPHWGQGSGIVDRFGYELEFPSAFRLSRRDSKPRSIVKMRRSA